MKKRLIAILAALLLLPSLAHAQKVKPDDWAPQTFFFNVGQSVSREIHRYGEDSQFMVGFSGTLEPGEIRNVTALAYVWDTRTGTRLPQSGIPFGWPNWGPGSTIMVGTLYPLKGTKLADIEFSFDASNQPSFRNNLVPEHNPGVPYNGALVAAILPHLAWKPCDPGWSTRGGDGNLFGFYSDDGHGTEPGGDWQLWVHNKSGRRVNVSLVAEGFPGSCDTWQRIPPQYRGYTVDVDLWFRGLSLKSTVTEDDEPSQELEEGQ